MYIDNCPYSGYNKKKTEKRKRSKTMFGNSIECDSEKNSSASRSDSVDALKKKKIKIYFTYLIVACIAFALLIGGVCLAVKGFSYKESENSRINRSMQQISDYYGDGYDFSDGIEKTSSGEYSVTVHLWMGIGGVAMVVVGVFVYGICWNCWKKYKEVKKQLKEDRSDSSSGTFGGNRT